MSKTYKVSDIETILQLSRTKAYALVNQGLFPVIRIGKVIRIPAELFDNWMISQMN
ncbi:MAG TPA: helix-turn-helix domain-containing protein [Bacillota bacterium]|nr:helix-turn-helix domain-containing protein [Bacillota bacterium]